MAHLLRRIPTPVLAFALALAVYSLAAGPTPGRQSIAPHYVYLAEAMLHGRLDLTQPPSSYDLLIYEGRAYVAGSPMPALMMLPFVAVFGSGLSDILFTVVVGTLNVMLVHSLFRRWWLTLLFAFGTPHLYLASLGSYWFTAHVVAVFFGLLAIRKIGTVEDLFTTETRRDEENPSVPCPCPLRSSGGPLGAVSPWLKSGLWLACAGLARPTMLFEAVFFLLYIVLSQRGESLTTKTLSHQELPNIPLRPGVLVVNKRALLAFGVAIAIGLAAHGLYNAARFGSPTEFGYRYTAGAPNITSAYARYGGFNPRFLPCNLFVSILNPPEVNGNVPPIVYDVCDYLLEGVDLSDASAPITPNPLGMSLLIVTPAFLLIFAAWRREPLILAAWAGLLATMIPLWLYHNTGSLQFGYRYWMDAAPMWLVLLSEVKPLRRRGAGTFARVLLVASIAINVWGFSWMFEKFAGVTWFEMIRGM
jgi:hypothetical protein